MRMKICFLILLTTFANLSDGQSLEDAGPELDLEYYSNLQIDENELNEDSGDHTLDANLFEGDIDGVIIDESNQIIDTAPPKNRQADVRSGMKWPNGVIPYLYYDGYSEKEKAVIVKAIVRLQEATCLKMVARTTESNYLYIYPKKGGCSSWVGPQGGKQVLNINVGCFSVGTVLHELMHAAGFYHEQSRADRDEYVKINWENIGGAFKNAFRKLPLFVITHLKAPYDYCSIMHYGSYAFSINKQPTIVKIQPGGCELGQRKGFSDMDIRKLNTWYQCNGYPQVLTKCDDEYSHSRCDYLASRGFCKGSYEDWMAKNCNKSCGICK